MKEIPQFLINKLTKQYPSSINDILNGYKENRATTLRVNTLKSSKEEIINILKENEIAFDDVSWYNEALIIYSDINKIKELNIYDEGKIYLQSLSSMIPPLILNPKEQEMILDMAAAPGGKTTEIQSLANNKAMITATEKNKIRSDRLKYNIEKQGAKKINVLNIDARKIDEFYRFDKILLDAPCSGSGTLSINDNSIDSFNEELIKRSISIQKELITEAIKHLKINGELTYSTCSILKEENEDIIEYILQNNNIELVPIEPIKNIPLLENQLPGTITVCPTKYYEGFYVAKIKRIN